MIATRKAFTVILVSAALLLTGCSAARPLHRSEAGIRASLLKRTPPGTPKKDVETFIAREGWHPLSTTQVPTETQSAIEVYFGEYFICGTWGFAMRGVWGVWSFDFNSRVIDIWVHKENDSL
jgi:hypothetical protein